MTDIADSIRARIARYIGKRDDAVRVLAHCRREDRAGIPAAQRVLAHCDAELDRLGKLLAITEPPLPPGDWEDPPAPAEPADDDDSGPRDPWTEGDRALAGYDDGEPRDPWADADRELAGYEPEFRQRERVNEDEGEL